MKNINNKHNITGQLEIWKQFDDGTEELHFSDHNVITSGMGVGLAYLYSNQGSDNVLDYQIKSFQVGSGTQPENSSTYELGAELTPTTQYGSTSFIQTTSVSQIKNGTSFASQPFALIPFHHIKRVGPTSVRYTLVLNKYSANNLGFNLSEAGLFMYNPTGNATPASILVAYRTFTAIEKTEEFSLIFKWSLNF